MSFFNQIVLRSYRGARSAVCRTILAYSCIKYVKIENQSFTYLYFTFQTHTFLVPVITNDQLT